MFPYTGSLGFKCGADGRRQRWQPQQQHHQRRGGISFGRTPDHNYQVTVDEVPPMTGFDRLRRDITPAEYALLESMDLSETRQRNTGKFLTLNRKRRRVPIRLDHPVPPVLVDDVYNGQIQCMLSRADRWQFNAFQLDTVSGGRSLPVLLLHLFTQYGLIEYFDLDVVRVWKCFSLIEEGYHSNNPYHNAIHASDVSQAMHCFLLERKIATHITPLEIMAALVAAVAHDLDHPGVNQPFLISTSNHLAALYKNSSVLENHHWRSAMACLTESGVFAHLEKHFWDELGCQVRSLILATDITRQQEFLTRFRRYLDTGILDLKEPEYRHFILQIALKCADICNPCRPWDISKTWSDRVCEEFFRQGDFERQLNLPVTSLCDRYAMSKPKIQAGFFRFVVSPLFEVWDKFQQTPASQNLMDNLRKNQETWDQMVTDEAAAAAKGEAGETESAPEADTAEEEDDEEEEEEAEMEEREKAHGSVTSLEDRDESLIVNVWRGRRHSMPLSLPKMLPRTTIRRQSFPRHNKLADLRTLSAEALMPDSRITSISAEAHRLAGLFNDRRGSRHLVKQMTYPPVRSQPHIHSKSWEKACAELLPGVICPSVLEAMAAMNNSDSDDNIDADSPEVTDSPADGDGEAGDCPDNAEERCENGCGTPPIDSPPAPGDRCGQVSGCGEQRAVDGPESPVKLHSKPPVDDDKENADPGSIRCSLLRQNSDDGGGDLPKMNFRKSTSQGFSRLATRRGSAPVGLLRSEENPFGGLRGGAAPVEQRRRGSIPFDSIAGRQSAESSLLSSRRSSLPISRRESLMTDPLRFIPSGSESEGGSTVMLLRDDDCCFGSRRPSSPDPFSLQGRLNLRRSSMPAELLRVGASDFAKKGVLSLSNRDASAERPRKGSGGLELLNSLLRQRLGGSLDLDCANNENAENLVSPLQRLAGGLWPVGSRRESLSKQSESFDLGTLRDANDDDVMDALDFPDATELWNCINRRRSSVPVDVCLLPRDQPSNNDASDLAAEQPGVP